MCGPSELRLNVFDELRDPVCSRGGLLGLDAIQIGSALFPDGPDIGEAVDEQRQTENRSEHRSVFLEQAAPRKGKRHGPDGHHRREVLLVTRRGWRTTFRMIYAFRGRSRC